MNDGFVADSSVAISWAVESQSSPSTGHLLNDIAFGRPFIVPVLWMFETANALCTLTRRRRITHQQYEVARHSLRSLMPIIDEEGPRLALGRISDLADEHHLSVYDATYLEIALRRGLPIATRDTALNDAARRCRLETLL